MSLIIGDPADPHVEAVVEHLTHEPTILDAATLSERRVTITSAGISVGGDRLHPQAGWLRRLAPAGWAESLAARGVEAAARAAAVSALAAIVRDGQHKWLTEIDVLGGLENKPHQYRLAAAVGVPVPDWIVTTDPNDVPSSGEWISKPLGPGSFIDEGGTGYVVPTVSVDLADAQVIARVPFILQRRVTARTHARVITVNQEVWSATLSAEGLPADWRMLPEAHDAFTDAPAPEAVHVLATSLARETAVGYSAQDWIEDTDGRWWFVDLNPAGQWLFLPPFVAAPATHAIARHLDSFA